MLGSADNSARSMKVLQGAALPTSVAYHSALTMAVAGAFCVVTTAWIVAFVAKTVAGASVALGLLFVPRVTLAIMPDDFACGELGTHPLWLGVVVFVADADVSDAVAFGFAGVDVVAFDKAVGEVLPGFEDCVATCPTLVADDVGAVALVAIVARGTEGIVDSGWETWDS